METTVEKLSLDSIRHANTLNEIIRQTYAKPSIEPVNVGTAKTGAGFAVTCLGYTINNDDEAILTNIAGTRTSVEAVIASFHNNRITNALTIDSGYYGTTLKTTGDKWYVYRAEWKAWGMVNALIASHRLVEPRATDSRTFLMAETANELAKAVYSRLYNLLPIPVMEWWAIPLFREAVEKRKLFPLRGKGMNVYELEMNTEWWQGAITKGIQDGRLIWTKEEHAELTSEPEVETVAVSSDEDAA